MDYPLKRLHVVRTLREQLAQSDLAAGRQRLDQADQALSRRQLHLEKHRLLKAEMEVQLFKQIDKKEVTVGELERYRGRIAELSIEEKKRQAEVQQAEICKGSAHKEVDLLVSVVQKRHRQRTKLKELRKVWNTKVEEEENWLAEEEMEEMVMNRFARQKSR